MTKFFFLLIALSCSFCTLAQSENTTISEWTDNNRLKRVEKVPAEVENGAFGYRILFKNDASDQEEELYDIGLFDDLDDFVTFTNFLDSVSSNSKMKNGDRAKCSLSLLLHSYSFEAFKISGKIYFYVEGVPADAAWGNVYYKKTIISPVDIKKLKAVIKSEQ